MDIKEVLSSLKHSFRFRS